MPVSGGDVWSVPVSGGDEEEEIKSPGVTPAPHAIRSVPVSGGDEEEEIGSQGGTPAPHRETIPSGETPTLHTRTLQPVVLRLILGHWENEYPIMNNQYPTDLSNLERWEKVRDTDL